MITQYNKIVNFYNLSKSSTQKTEMARNAQKNICYVNYKKPLCRIHSPFPSHFSIIKEPVSKQDSVYDQTVRLITEQPQQRSIYHPSVISSGPVCFCAGAADFKVQLIYLHPMLSKKVGLY